MAKKKKKTPQHLRPKPGTRRKPAKKKVAKRAAKKKTPKKKTIKKNLKKDTSKRSTKAGKNDKCKRNANNTNVAGSNKKTSTNSTRLAKGSIPISTKTAKKTSDKNGSRKPKPKVGRPTEYRPEFAERAKKSILLGHTNKQTLQHLNISEPTFYKWMRDHPEFADAIKVTRDLINTDKIKQAMVKTALGYNYEEVTREPALNVIMAALGPKQKITDAEIQKMLKTLGADKDGMIKTKKVTKHKPADGGIMKTYLFNKAPAEFQQKQTLDMNVKCDALDKLLEEIDGSGSRLPTE